MLQPPVFPEIAAESDWLRRLQTALPPVMPPVRRIAQCAEHLPVHLPGEEKDGLCLCRIGSSLVVFGGQSPIRETVLSQTEEISHTAGWIRLSDWGDEYEIAQARFEAGHSCRGELEFGRYRRLSGNGTIDSKTDRPIFRIGISYRNEMICLSWHVRQPGGLPAAMKGWLETTLGSLPKRLDYRTKGWVRINKSSARDRLENEFVETMVALTQLNGQPIIARSLYELRRPLLLPDD